MKKEDMRRWLNDRLQTQIRLTMGAFAGMVAMGLIAATMEFTLFYLIISIGFVGSRIGAILITLGILGTVQWFTWMRLPKELPDTEHEAELASGTATIRVAPNMTAVWTYAFGSLETERSWAERLLGVLTLPQRMSCAAWFTWNRLTDVKSIAVEPCAAAIRLLQKEGERVEIKVMEEKLKLADIPATMRQLSMIDGVVFLTRRTFGVSLASRLTDDMVDWQKKLATPVDED